MDCPWCDSIDTIHLDLPTKHDTTHTTAKHEKSTTFPTYTQDRFWFYQDRPRTGGSIQHDETALLLLSSSSLGFSRCLSVCGWLGAPTQGNAGYKATSSLSLEKGYRHWHGDLRPTDNPFMANLGFTCKLKTDTPFLGRSALEARRAQADKGLPERLACFTVDKTVPLHGAEAVYRDGICVGVLREAGFGFSVDASIGYGMVERRDGGAADLSYLREGEYSIETATHGRVPATLHTKALFDPSGDRVKGIY